MAKVKKIIKYKKERVVISDVLPFEIPITFSNRFFYRFLVTNGIEVVGDKVIWKTRFPEIEEIVKLLFGFRKKTANNAEINISQKSALRTIPFNYKICHKENDFRELTIMHPKNQLCLIEFYEKYKDLILYYNNISPFSIRKAAKISSFFFYEDAILEEKPNVVNNSEESDKDYENLKTFFAYKEFGNIHKFYESKKYHFCEKKYNNLFKFDISKCFDSIYSHSVSWALLGKNYVKTNLSDSNNSFGGKIDAIVQNMNYGETNGIVIGPEFSRIFAEIILQKIDVLAEKAISKIGLVHKIDYEVFRYVDDFFVFYNKDSTKEKVLNEFRLTLKDFKLYVNDSKTVVYTKPIITPQTIAKQKISELFNNVLRYKLANAISIFDEIDTIENLTNAKNQINSNIVVDSSYIIIKFKSILKELSVDYKDVLNFSLALIEKRVIKMVSYFKTLEKNENRDTSASKALLEILELTFFFYSVYPRVNTTIRLCRILRHIVVFGKKQSHISNDLKHLLFKSIYDNIYSIFSKNRSLKHTQVETLYLLIVLGELGKEYWLDADVLNNNFDIQKNKFGELEKEDELNYFVITVLLFYIKNKKRYVPLQAFLKEHIVRKFNLVNKDDIDQHTELVLLLFDCLSCPYLDLKFKKKLLTLHGVKDAVIQDKIIKKRKYWFTKWTNFDFGRELDAKISQEVY